MISACSGVHSELLVQEFLPGAEYSIDVLATQSGNVVAVVPRERLKVDSGVAVTARTVRDPALETFATRVARIIGLRGVANVQVREDRHGHLSLLEINPRFPGTMALTVASGVNMPLLALMDLLGFDVDMRGLAYREVAIVRTYQEHQIDCAELDELKGRSEIQPLLQAMA